MMKCSFGFLSILMVLASPITAFAASGGHSDEHGIPSVVIFQFINFAMYIALLVFVLRKPIRAFFKARVENFNQALVKAQQARQEVENKKREIQEQLTRLETTSESSVANARSEAAALMLQIQKQAEELSQKLMFEANQTVAIEVEKAKMELRRELLEQSVAMAEKMLKDKMAEPDQKRLQTEFVDKIREAHP